MNTNNPTNPNIAKWMPLWIADLRRETNGQPIEFKAMYINLMVAAWESGGCIPDDEDHLCRVSGATSSQWKANRQALANLFVPGEGQWTHNLIREELVKAHKIHADRTEAGRSGAVNRWTKTRAQAKDATDELLKKISTDGAPY